MPEEVAEKIHGLIVKPQTRPGECLEVCRWQKIFFEEDCDEFRTF